MVIWDDSQMKYWMLSFITRQSGTAMITQRGLSHFRAIRRARSQLPPSERQNIVETVNKYHHLHLETFQKMNKTKQSVRKENRQDACISVASTDLLPSIFFIHFADSVQ